MLPSHYQTDKTGKTGGRRQIVDRRRQRFCFLVGRRLFSDAPKLKVSLTDPPIFRDFVIVEASGDSLRMISQPFEEKIMISAEGRPIIGCQSADDRQAVGKWHFSKQPSTDKLGWWSPDYRPIINFGLYNACIHNIYEINSCICYFGIHFIGPCVQILSVFVFDFLVELFVWRFKINVTTYLKLMQHNAEYNLIY